MDKESPQKNEWVTIDGHIKGSESSHNQKKRSFKAACMKNMSDEEFKREMNELKVHLSMLVNVL